MIHSACFAMRGRDDRAEGLFSYVRLEERVPQDHPLRAIRALADDALAQLTGRSEAFYPGMGRPSIAATFASEALDDAARRLNKGGLDVVRVGEFAAARMVDAASDAKVSVVVTPHAPMGFTATMLDALEKDLLAAELSLVRPRRSWDSAFWPYTQRGFIQLRNAIPHALAAAGVAF